MILYINESADNVIGKVLKRVGNVSVRLPATIDVINPVLKLTGIVERFNYCYLPELERYYFVKSAQVRGRFMELFLEVDVLETYKDLIVDSSCKFKRPIAKGDYGEISDGEIVDYSVIENDSNVSAFNGRSVVLVTLGDGIK